MVTTFFNLKFNSKCVTVVIRSHVKYGMDPYEGFGDDYYIDLYGITPPRLEHIFDGPPLATISTHCMNWVLPENVCADKSWWDCLLGKNNPSGIDPTGWLSGQHINAWSRLILLERPSAADWTIAPTELIGHHKQEPNLDRILDLIVYVTERCPQQANVGFAGVPRLVSFSEKDNLKGDGLNVFITLGLGGLNNGKEKTLVCFDVLDYPVGCMRFWSGVGWWR
ncbi:hypothetical protein Tco_0947495 [Tanacetum coccineum]